MFRMGYGRKTWSLKLSRNLVWNRFCHAPLMLIYKAGIDFALGFSLPPSENLFQDEMYSHKESFLWNLCLKSLTKSGSGCSYSWDNWIMATWFSCGKVILIVAGPLLEARSRLNYFFHAGKPISEFCREPLIQKKWKLLKDEESRGKTVGKLEPKIAIIWQCVCIRWWKLSREGVAWVMEGIIGFVCDN